MSFWINYTGRRDEYPLPDGATNRGRLNQTKKPKKKRRKLKKRDERKYD